MVQHVIDLTANKRKTEPFEVSYIPEKISSQTNDYSLPQRAYSYPVPTSSSSSTSFLPRAPSQTYFSPISLDNLFKLAKLGVDIAIQKEPTTQSYGLFALRDFSSGELITWYDGMVMPTAEYLDQPKSFPFKRFEGCSSVVIDPSYVPSIISPSNFRQMEHGLGAMMTHVLGGGNAQLFSCQVEINVPYRVHPKVSASDRSCIEHTIFLLQACQSVRKGQEFFLNYSTQDFVVLRGSQTAPLIILNNHKSSDSLRKRPRI